MRWPCYRIPLEIGILLRTSVAVHLLAWRLWQGNPDMVKPWDSANLLVSCTGHTSSHNAASGPSLSRVPTPSRTIPYLTIPPHSILSHPISPSLNRQHLWDWFPPAFNCYLKARLGRFGDGGKAYHQLDMESDEIEFDWDGMGWVGMGWGLGMGWDGMRWGGIG